MTATTTRPTAPHRAAHVGLWALQVLLAALFAFSAFGKLAADPQQVAGFTAMGLGVVGMYTVGALELLGAIALFVPRLVGLAGLAFVVLMAGAVVATLLVGGGALALVPATVGALCAVVAWGRRRSTVELAAAVRRS